MLNIGVMSFQFMLWIFNIVIIIGQYWCCVCPSLVSRMSSICVISVQNGCQGCSNSVTLQMVPGTYADLAK